MLACFRRHGKWDRIKFWFPAWVPLWTTRKHSWLTTKDWLFTRARSWCCLYLSYWNAPGAKRLVVAHTAVIVQPVEELLWLWVLLVHELPLFVRQKDGMHQLAFNFERDFSKWSLLLDDVFVERHLVLRRTILFNRRLTLVKSVIVICGLKH